MLPRWRGAAPIQRAIEAGDSESSVPSCKWIRPGYWRYAGRGKLRYRIT
ncbi:MAG: hypothetical protein ACFHHU_05600 [Porticoccaceae bacterium]